MKATLQSSLLLATLLSALSQACAGAPPPPPEVKSKAKPEKQVTPDPRYTSLPTPTEAPTWVPPRSERTTLENGLSVWQMNHGSTPLVSIHLMLPTGAAFDPKEMAGLTLVTADMLDEGAGKYSALELSDKLGELASDYSASVGVDYTLLSMNALSENLEESLDLLADIVLRPKFSKAEFDRRKKHHLANALTAQDNPGASRAKTLSRVLFKDGYAGPPPSGTLQSLESISLPVVKKHAKRLTVPEGAHLVIAGMVDKVASLKAVKSAFGQWKGQHKALETKPLKHKLDRRAYVVDFPGAAQSSLAVVTSAGSDSDPNHFAEEVMNEKFGGSFTGRINMNLREDKGYTYGASSHFRRFRKAGYFSIASNVKSEKTGASLQEIFKELVALCDERPLTDVERNEGVDGLLLGYPMKFDQVSSMGYRLVSLPIHHRGVDYWTKWPSEIKKITTQRANQAAAPYCDPARYSVIIAGDRESLLPQLKALKIDVTLMDRNGLILAEATSKAPPVEKKK